MTAVLLLLAFLLATPSFAQCSWTPRTSNQLRATVYDLSIDGNNLWVATSYGVSLYDRSVDPPELLDTIAVPGPTTIVRARGGIAYAGSGSEIHVLRRNGLQLERLGGNDVGATVNDIALVDSYLFAATSAGIGHFAIFSPTSFTATGVTLAVTKPGVTSFALDGNTLYATDSDSTVEVFNVAAPALPQKTGTLQSLLPRPTNVAVAGGRTYVSDGQETDIFLGTTNAATVPFGALAFAQFGEQEHFVAGLDRRFHALDFSLPARPTELFEAELFPSGGSLNRVQAMQVAGGHLYVAAGDVGLLSYDLATFGRPYPVHGYAIGASPSVVAITNTGYAATPDGMLWEMNLADSGVGFQRTWSTTAVQTVQDATSGLVLTSAGARLSYWTVIASPPVAISTADLSEPIRSAVVIGTTGYVLLQNGSIWSVNLAQEKPTPVRVDIASATEMARGGNGITLATANDNGTTTLRHFANGNLTAAPVSVTIDGVPTSGIASGDNSAAMFTFRGVSHIDFASKAVTVMPQSNTVIARRLALSGKRIVEVTDRSLLVWNVETKSLERSYSLPAEAQSVAIAPAANVAFIGTADGVATVKLDTTKTQPRLTAELNGNRYYQDLAATADRAYLLDVRGVDVYETTTLTPRLIRSIRNDGIIDVAASDAGLVALSGNNRVIAYSPDGYPVAETTIDDGPDTQPLTIHLAGNAVWVSISRGCQTTGCEKRTFVLNRTTLARTATIAGGVLDVATLGNRAYALFDMPAETRAYDITNPLNPAALASIATAGDARSIAARANGALTFGDRVRVYNASLALQSTHLDAATPSPLQRIRADGDCVLLSGRTFRPQLFNATMQPGSSVDSPSAVRTFAIAGDRVLLLTDHSLEIWSKSVPPAPSRKRSAR